MTKEISSMPVLFAVVVLLAVTLLWALVSLRACLRARAIKKRIASGEVVAATNFWCQALMRDWDAQRPVGEAQIKAFQRRLAIDLATTSVNAGSYPDIGVFYHAPHNYGVDHCLRGAAGQVGMPCGNILRAMLPSIRMRISSAEIAVKSMFVDEWTVLWRKGDGAAKLIEAGRQYRPKHAAA